MNVCLRKECYPLSLYLTISVIGVLLLLFFDTNRRDTLQNIFVSGLWVAWWTLLIMNACCTLKSTPLVWFIVSIPILLWLGLVVMVLTKKQ
jgi:hypothetical protein